jgi:glucose-6-phosphate isomerase
LGTKAIYDAMASIRDLSPHESPRLLFIDTVDPALLAMAHKIIQAATSADELFFLVITKSGTTTETIYNAESILAAFADKFGGKSRRVVVLSETGSPLLAAARTQEMYTIALPPMVGGRYSVMTPVGLIPLGLLGFGPADLQKSAARMLDQCVHPDIDHNPAARSALTQFYFYNQGIRQHDTFVFVPALESVGKWYRQLLAESIGKPSTTTNTPIGITPTVTVGSTDLHSVGQLYVGGPKDRLTTFVSVASRQHDEPLTAHRAWPEVLPYLGGQTPTAVMSAIYEGTKTTYDANSLPFMEVTLPELTPESIVAFMQFKMCEVMMLGYLLGVNPFDQPQVEQYKTVTKKLLTNL